MVRDILHREEDNHHEVSQSPLAARPVTAAGRNFLTAPEFLAEEMRLLRPSTLLLRCLAWSSRLVGRWGGGGT